MTVKKDYPARLSKRSYDFFNERLQKQKKKAKVSGQSKPAFKNAVETYLIEKGDIKAA